RRAVVLGLAAARMAECFRVHHIAEAGALGEVHVLLHIAERDAWPTRQRQRERARGVLELGIGDQPGHEAERLRLGAAQDGRGEVELARLGGTDELCQEIAAAEIAGQCHLGKGGGEPRGIAGDAQVAGKRQRQACAGGGAAQHGDGGLRYLVQEAGGLHALAQAAGALIEALAAPFGHGLDVAAGAEGASGAGENDDRDLMIARGALQRVVQAGEHFRVERVEPVRPVHRQRQNAVIEPFQEYVSHFPLPHVTLRHASIVSRRHLLRKDVVMLDKLAGLAIVALGLVNAVPSPAAVHPVAVTADYIDDDLTGSGMELRDRSLKLPQRRNALRLRVLSDGDRVALLRLIDDIPTVVGDCIPECAGDPLSATLSIQLIGALYEGSPLTVEAIAARSLLPAEIVEDRLERLESSGLVRLSPRSNRSNTRRVSPTSMLRACGDDLLDRLYYSFTQALNRS